MEKKALYDEEEGASSSARYSGESSDVLREIQETNFADSQLTDAAVGEDFAELHIAIENGDMETVKRVVENHEEERHFSHDGTSALYKAFECEKHEIISFLIHSGAKFVGYENEDVYDLNIDLDRVNHHLFKYNRKSERSCVYRLTSISQSPQDLNAERYKALMKLYHHLCDSEVNKLLLKVLENEDFDIVFDFKSDKINRVYRLCEEESEIFGLTLTNVREIFIGALNLLSKDPKKRAKVYGVVAEELCHLALTIVFQNNAKPYRKENSSLIHEFREIIRSVESLKEQSCPIESVIEDVYGYPYNQWECELIARVPHVFGIYGEESGRRILQESSELCRLLIFYENVVLPKCREYVDASLNTKSDRIMKQLTKKNDFISFKEKRIQPLKEDFASFRDCAVVEEGVFVISTNCIKLCALQVYHELKPEYGEQLERKCLFIDSECFKKKRDVILKALKCKLFYYLVLIVDDKELQHQILEGEYLDHFKELISEGINAIIISNSQLLGTEFEDRFVEYNWDHLTDEYQNFRACPIEYIFKREREVILMKKEDVLHHFSEEDIAHIINGDLIEVRDGVHRNCQDYNPETYVEREFWTIVIDRSIFQEFPEDTVILIHGLQIWQCKEFSINESCVQCLEGPYDYIQEDKLIFVCNNKFPTNFKDFVRKTKVKNKICLKYDRKMFYLMDSEGDVFKQYEKEIRQTEEEMIDWLKNNKSLIVSENAGCGKSTVMSRLIRRVKERIHNSWVLRVDLNKFSIKDEGSDSEEEMYEDIFLMFGFKNGFERCHFRKEINQRNCFIFLDAFDEIPFEYKTKALELISFLRNKTDARIMITTRMHHQKEIEESLSTFSHQLVPFDNLTQVTYLGNLWKWKLKFPNEEGGQNIHKVKKAISAKTKSIIGELEKEKMETDLVDALKEIKLEDRVDSIRKKIDGLELNGLANSIINKMKLDKETQEFMGIPLHLYMTGVIHWDSNFNANRSSGIYNIYSQFVERKILIYVVEKQNMSQNNFYDFVMEKTKNDAYRIHIKLANELMDNGRIDCRNLKEEEKDLCKALGIVFIKGEDVEFLHFTFAEYFRAESIRLKLEKETFADVLFEDKFKVVRRFLANSLKEKHFENLTEEVLTSDLLLEVLTKFFNQLAGTTSFSFYLYFPSLTDCDSSVRILKCLIDKFENIVNSEKLSEFIKEIEDNLWHLEHSYVIGGIITVKMTKMLINRNFEAYSEIIFGVVLYYSELKDVIEILDECISTSDECETNVKRKTRIVLKILKLRDKKGWGVFDYALRNERIEVLVPILEYFREIVGNEESAEINKSRTYRRALDKMIENQGFDEVSKLMKSLHFTFGNEIEAYFHENHKIRIIIASLNVRDESRNAFQEAIDLIIECFGIANLKKTFLSPDSYGNYLIHYLIKRKINLMENYMNIIKKYLEDKYEIKQFLMFEDGESKNVFLLAGERKDSFREILKIYSEYLEKEEIKEMLISCYGGRWNVLRLLFQHNSSIRIGENLLLINHYLANEDMFREFLKSKNKYSMNIFFFALEGGYELDFYFLNCYLSESEIIELLTERVEARWTCLHYGANFNLTILPHLLDYSFQMLCDDQNQFEELILAKHNEYKYTFLHLVVKSNKIRPHQLIDVLKSVKEKVRDECFKELLRSRDLEGETFLQIQMKEERNEELIRELEEVLEKDLIEKLLEKQKLDNSDSELGDNDSDSNDELSDN